MRRLPVMVLLVLWSSTALAARTYDNLDRAVDDLTDLLVLRAQVNGVKLEEESIYIRRDLRPLRNSFAHPVCDAWCCFSHPVVGSPREWVGLFRARGAVVGAGASPAHSDGFGLSSSDTGVSGRRTCA